jgi:hypothetical protein
MKMPSERKTGDAYRKIWKNGYNFLIGTDILRNIMES